MTRIPTRKIEATRAPRPRMPLRKGTRVVHVEHGACVVVKTKRNDPHTVWVRMDSDKIEGTVDIRLLRWPHD